jgi:alpha-ketoglutarate-dependent taurine dioxygenase
MSRLSSVKPKAAHAVTAPRVTIGSLRHGDALPVLVDASAGSASIREWAGAHRELIEQTLRTVGGVLFRGFDVPDPETFREFVTTVAPELLEYKERSTPRTEIGGRIYTSTEYPAHQHIALHNEFSYAYTWPLRIAFFAQQPAEEGGETPIADSRKVYAGMAPDVRERFAARGVMYVRNYGSGVDLPWQDAFQTQDRAEVEAYCRQAPLDWEWLDNDRLRTRQRRPAVGRHPVTGEMVWFNQAHLFHVSNLGADAEAAMRSVFAEEDLPRNAYYGDGTPIPAEDLAEVRRAWEAATMAFPWQQGDVLLLDNMLIAHGRRPYRGSRRILAALAQPYTLPIEERTSPNDRHR